MVRFSDFQTLDPETADVARELLENAGRARSAFNSFLSIWMAFNGWMSCVTNAATDAAMITAMAENGRVREAYDQLVRSSAEFNRHLTRFSAMWPVINVRDARNKLGRDVFLHLSREQLLAACAEADVKLQPATWDGGVPSWEQTLRTIYAVRCNMFHGMKSPQNFRDRNLILESDHILRTFIELSGCFAWRDESLDDLIGAGHPLDL